MVKKGGRESSFHVLGKGKLGRRKGYLSFHICGEGGEKAGRRRGESGSGTPGIRTGSEKKSKRLPLIHIMSAVPVWCGMVWCGVAWYACLAFAVIALSFTTLR